MDATGSKKVVEMLGWPSAVVGALVGISTLVGWVATEAFADTAYLVVQIAGLVYVGVWLVAVLVPVARKPWSLPSKLFVAAAAGLGVTAIATAWVVPWNDRNQVMLFIAGLVGLLAGLAISIGKLGKHRLEKKKKELRELEEEITQWRECVDCAETIRASAKVCHYCGFRYEPKPFIVAEVRGDPRPTVT